MPTDIVTVHRVFSMPTRRPGWTQFLITGHTVAYPSTTEQYSTVNPFQASLCERAKETQLPVQVTWKDSRWGRDMVAVEIACE
jgi:hypothetical protein